MSCRRADTVVAWLFRDGKLHKERSFWWLRGDRVRIVAFGDELFGEVSFTLPNTWFWKVVFEGTMLESGSARREDG